MGFVTLGISSESCQPGRTEAVGWPDSPFFGHGHRAVRRARSIPSGLAIGSALKHGVRAPTLVVPGEDGDVFEGRRIAWTADLQPRNALERGVVVRAATVTWQLERADRAEAARLTDIIRHAPDELALRQTDEAAALGQRLFQDPRGPLPLYPHSLYNSPASPRISAAAVGEDPNAPPRLILRLEATAAGCQWLLDQWAELRCRLDHELPWQSPDKLKAIRLLGRQPLDAADSEVVALIFQACHVLDPQPRHAAARAELREAQTLAEAVRVLKTMGPGVFSRLQDEGEGTEAESL